MSDDRLAWEEHSLDVEQLDLFASEPAEQLPRGAYDEPHSSQMTELHGETWQDAFGSAAA